MKLAQLSGAFLLMMASSPAMAKDPPVGLTIMAGQNWAFRIVDGQPAEARLLATGEKAQSGEITASLSTNTGLMLSIMNRTGKWLNYRAFLTRGTDDRGRPTSVCTLAPEALIVESWPGESSSVRISHFTAAREGALICK